MFITAVPYIFLCVRLGGGVEGGLGEVKVKVRERLRVDQSSQ